MFLLKTKENISKRTNQNVISNQSRNSISDNLATAPNGTKKSPSPSDLSLLSCLESMADAPEVIWGCIIGEPLKKRSKQRDLWENMEK